MLALSIPHLGSPKVIGPHQVSFRVGPITRGSSVCAKELVMTVTVDHETLAVENLKLQTVGQVLNHLQRENRLVVQVLLDGQAPTAAGLGPLRQTTLAGHTLFIETADPRELALEVLDEVVQQVNESE